MEMKCFFTGHRPSGLPWGYAEESADCVAFKIKLKNYILQLIEGGCRCFICGMAMGIDLIAAEIVLNLKYEYNLILEAALPCENQCKFWSEEYIERYNKVLERCDKITYIFKKYTKDCMRFRNFYMVDKSNCVVAVWNGKEKSGTAQTINYAKNKNKKIYLIKI